MSQQDMDQDWEITVTVPLRLPAEQREALFSAVADAVAEWEPEDRTDWDAMVSAHPETFSLLLWLHAEKEWQLEQAEASRRDGAAEADRLGTALEAIALHCEELSANADARIGDVAGADLAWAAWGKAAQWLRHARNQQPCALPRCAVHPEADR